MKKYQLNKENYIKEKQLHIERLELDNILALEYFTPNIQFLIDSFNKEYQWDDMFNIEEVKNRIVHGHTLFILYYDGKEIGYVWFREMDKDTCFLYNLYVTNIIKRPKYSPIWFVNRACSHMLKHYKKIQCECEDWHSAAQNTFVSNGFIEI